MDNVKFSRYGLFTKMMSIGKSMRLYCHKAIEADGFTLNETDVLLSLASGNNTVKEISRESNISKGCISMAVDSLKKKGFITASTSKSDRRSVTVTPTDAAKDVFEKLREAEDEFFKKFMLILPQNDDSMLTRIFEALQKLSPASLSEKFSKKDDRHEKD